MGSQRLEYFPGIQPAHNSNHTAPSQVYCSMETGSVLLQNDVEALPSIAVEVQQEDFVALATSSAITSKDMDTMQQVTNELAPSSTLVKVTTQVNPSVLALPETNHFLVRLELLLSMEELKKFQELFSAVEFNVANHPYQSWLLLKCATLPDEEKRAVEQVTMCSPFLKLLFTSGAGCPHSQKCHKE